MRSPINIFSIVLLAVMACLGIFNTYAYGATADPVLLQYIQANKLQAAGLDGTGIKIGVISDGVIGIEALESDGTLPTVTIYQNDHGGGKNEGNAMLQVVHQIAPNAQLYFCSASDYFVSGCVADLVNTYGVNIVTNDILGDLSMSPTSQAAQVENVEAANPGLLFVNAAGDQGNDVFESQFTGVSLTVGGQAIQAMDFGAALGQSSNPYNSWTVPANTTISPAINTSDDPSFPTPATNNIMGIWVLDSSNNVLASKTGQYTSLGTFWTNSSSNPVTVKIVVGLITQNNTNQIYIGLDDQTVLDGVTAQYTTTGGAGGLFATDPLTIQVGASAEGSNNMQPWTQTGPYMVMWSATQTGVINPGTGQPELAYTRLAQPQYFNTPHLTGADSMAIKPFTGWPFSNFVGTSAAAPTVAGVAALLMQAGLTRDQIVTNLEQSAKPLVAAQSGGTYNGIDGYGLVQGYAALLASGAQIPQPAITASTGSIQTGQSVTFTGECSVTGGLTITGYNWNFGNGQTSTQQNPGAITYNTAGSYTATLNCTASNGLSSGDPATAIVNVTNPTGGGGGGGSGGGSSSGGGGSLGLLSLVVLLVTFRLKNLGRRPVTAI